ncbi:MAG: hypothetical protein WC314_19940 [Vulcanimicrobiota bacterium]
MTPFHLYTDGDGITSADLNAVRAAINQLERRRHELLTGTQNGINLVFTTSAAPNPATLRVRVNGIPNLSPAHYTVSGNQITFEHPPASWWVLEAEYEEAE